MGPTAVLFNIFFCFAISTSAADDTSNPTEVEEVSLERTERSFEPPARPNSYWDDPHFRPYFDNTTDRNVTYQLSKTAYLHCRIRQLGDRVVSWVRQRDLHILTVGKYTYTTDQRYTSIHVEGSEDWTLEIKYTRKKDEGIYECQVSTEPKMSLAIQLNVVVSKATIPEGPMLYVQSGSSVNLTCIVTEPPPVFVFWYHDDRMVNYDAERRIRVSTDKSVSRLQILSAQAADSGHYSCQPSYADPANVTLQVLLNGRWTHGGNTANMDKMKGDKPAAIHDGRRQSSSSRAHPSLPLFVLMLVLVSDFLLL